MESTNSRKPNTLWHKIYMALKMFFTTTIILLIIGCKCQRALAHQANVTSSLQKSEIPPGYSGLCSTPGCVKAAEELIGNMNTTVDPCTDFYQFSCGGWIQKHTVPDDAEMITQFTLLRDIIITQLRQIVEKPVDETKDPSFIVKLKDFHQSCINTSRIEELGNQPLQEVLQKLGGWPIIEGDRWNESAFDWLETLIKMRELGYPHDIILELSVSSDLKNNSRNVIALNQPNLVVPDVAYFFDETDKSVYHAYFQLMIDAAMLLGAKSEDSIREELNEALNFEITLANLSLAREDGLNISELNNRMTVRELKEHLPSIQWNTFFSKILGESVSDDQDVVLYHTKFVQEVPVLLNTYNKRAIANYMIWRVVEESIYCLGTEWRKAGFKFISLLEGKKKENPRWELCILFARGMMASSMSNIYVKNFINEESKEEVLQMVKNIINEFKKILEETPWMDPVTRQHAKEKIDAMDIYIGYSPSLLNDSLLIDFYQALTIERDNYFSNIFNLNKWSTDMAFSSLKKFNDKRGWKGSFPPTHANAQYSETKNFIEFPAAILQGVFFSKDRPKYLNYGSIGFIIGHEITHGFDEFGRKFDKDGNMRNWWEPGTEEQFKQKSQCLIDQYSNYTIPGIETRLDGAKTITENIADNAGIKEALRAYRQWVKENGPEKALPGLNYTADQMFWISAANSWCSNVRPETLRLLFMTDSHSPYSLRTNVAFSNSPEFAKQFNCPLGSPMNPKMKCSVW